MADDPIPLHQALDELLQRLYPGDTVEEIRPLGADVSEEGEATGKGIGYGVPVSITLREPGGAWIVASSIAPTVAQKYPRAHRCCPPYRFPNSPNSSCNRRDDLPFRCCTSFDGANGGGADTSRCT